MCLRAIGAAGEQLPRVRAEMQAEVPVLFMSGYADSQRSSRGVCGQAVAEFGKPFTADELTMKVEQALARPASER